MRKSILMSAAIALSLPINVSADMFSEYWKTETLELSASELLELVAKTTAGDLNITGKKNSDTIVLVARFGGTEIDPSDYLLELRHQDNTAFIETKFATFLPTNTYIDLEIIIPHNMSLKVKDGSGDLSISNIDSSLTLDDGSGDAKISDIGGNTLINDGSGDLHVKNIAGDIQIDDGSGDLLVTKIEGNAKIDDRSGDVNVAKINGKMQLKDSSGDIKVRSVQGNVKIIDSSGSINVDSTGGNVSIEDLGGDIEVYNTTGEVMLIDKHGDVFIDGATDFNITKRGKGDIDSRNIENSN